MYIHKILKKEHEFILDLIPNMEEKHAKLIKSFIDQYSSLQKLSFLVRNESDIWDLVSEKDEYLKIANRYEYKQNMSTIEYMRFIKSIETEIDKYTTNEKNKLKEDLIEILKFQFPNLF